MEDIPAQAANGLFARNTGNAFRGPVKRGDPPVFVNGENTIGDGIQNDASVFFFLAWFVHGDLIHPQLSPDSLTGQPPSTSPLNGVSATGNILAHETCARNTTKARAPQGFRGHKDSISGPLVTAKMEDGLLRAAQYSRIAWMIPA